MTARASYELMLAEVKDSVMKLREMWVRLLIFIIGGVIREQYVCRAPFSQSRPVQFSSATH